MDALFDDKDQVDPNRDFLNELVGEGKKFSDAKALARGKAEADAMIARLIAEKAEMQNELGKRLNQEAFLDQLKAIQQPPTQPQDLNQEVREPQADILSEDKLQALIDQRYAEREKAAQAARNRQVVHDKLSEAFGEGYASIVKNKANELGVSVKFLEDAAAANPNVVFELLGVNRAPKAPINPAVPQNRFNSAATPQTPGTRNQKYWESLRAEKRKADPKWTYSAQDYIQMHNDALKQGASFFE